MWPLFHIFNYFKKKINLKIFPGEHTKRQYTKKKKTTKPRRVNIAGLTTKSNKNSSNVLMERTNKAIEIRLNSHAKLEMN